MRVLCFFAPVPVVRLGRFLVDNGLVAELLRVPGIVRPLALVEAFRSIKGFLVVSLPLLVQAEARRLLVLFTEVVPV